MVIVLVDRLAREPPPPIISSEPLSIVSVPVLSTNGMSSVTVTVPLIIMMSESVGGASLLQLDESDHTPVASPTQTPFGMKF